MHTSVHPNPNPEITQRKHTQADHHNNKLIATDWMYNMEEIHNREEL